MTHPEALLQGQTHRRAVSSSSYAPILINPASALPNPPSDSSARFPLGPRIRYPYPLPLLALADLVYTVHYSRNSPTSSTSVALCIARVVVLGVVLGCSMRWRSRGGWVGAVAGVSIGHAVWSVCEAQLTRGKEGDAGSEEPVQALFLGIVR